jgi:HK97 gp10 family phage protein
VARVTVRGSKQLNDKLKKLREKTQGRVRQGLAQAADEIVAMMKRQVPDGPGTGERDLGNSIKWRFGADEGGGSDAKSGRSASTRAVITAGDEKNPEARWVEFGTAPHPQGGSRPGTQHPGTPPQPFFFPAYRALRKRAKSLVAKSVREAVREVT